MQTSIVQRCSADTRQFVESIGGRRTIPRGNVCTRTDTSAGQAPDIGLFPDIPSLRKWIADTKAAMKAEIGGSTPGVKETDHQVTVRDGSKITCRVYHPESPPSAGSPLAVIYHGGGWCIGGLESEELLCRLLCSKLGVTAVNVDYRMAPEHKFPAAVHDSYDATIWVRALSRQASLVTDSELGCGERVLTWRRPIQRLHRRWD